MHQAGTFTPHFTENRLLRFFTNNSSLLTTTLTLTNELCTKRYTLCTTSISLAFLQTSTKNGS